MLTKKETLAAIQTKALRHAQTLQVLEQRFGTIPDFIAASQSFRDLLAEIGELSGLFDEDALARIDRDAPAAREGVEMLTDEAGG